MSTMELAAVLREVLGEFAVTRRERIATAALSGMLNRQDAWEDPDKAAKWSVEYADALIAALDAEPGKEE